MLKNVVEDDICIRSRRLGGYMQRLGRITEEKPNGNVFKIKKYLIGMKP